jgi:hypothetical protein
MQSQDYGPGKWSIGQRVEGAVHADVDRLFAEGAILRTHVLRPTWHFVARGDLRWLLALTGPRVRQAVEARRRAWDLDAKVIARAEKLLSEELVGSRHRTRAQLSEVLQKDGFDYDTGRMSHLLMQCELNALICSGGLDGKQQTYALVDERVPRALSFDRDNAAQELVRRYLRARGPSTIKDLRWWSSLRVADIKGGLEALGTEVSSETLDGLTYWWMEPLPRPTGKRRAAHFLQAFDETVVGYTESRYAGDPRAAAARLAFKNGTAPPGTVIIGDRLAGHWRRTIKKNEMQVKVRLYEELNAADLRALQAEAAKLGRFFGFEARVETSLL